MLEKAQRPGVLYLTASQNLIEDVVSLASSLGISKTRLCIQLIAGGMEWVRDPNPLANPSLEIADLRRKLHGHSVDRVGSIMREEPSLPSKTFSDNMLRIMEQALAAKDDVIGMQKDEIDRLRRELERHRNACA